MRRLVRVECPDSVARALDGRQAKVDSGSPVKKEWESFRHLKAYRELRKVLEEALGWRLRCSYCSDSYAADVEHFWPKENFPSRAFQFENLCLICAPCNRKKDARFPLTPDGHPLLIDPLFDDPWDSLFFTHQTGWISARMLSVVDGQPQYAEKGSVTLELLGDLINAQPVTSARARAWEQVVDRFAELVTGALRVRVS
ncbi:MAG: HNH endonuclease [Nocardioides sp.]